MQKQPLNFELMPANPCLGCGEQVNGGLGVKIYKDENNPLQILGEFHPSENMIGFPKIVHGGVIYTALDCMATWAGMLLQETKALWMLRSASTKYHRPAFQGQPILLSATIAEKVEDWQAIIVNAEARNENKDLLVEGNFKVIPVPPEKFSAMPGIEELPDFWEEWLNS